LRVKLIKLIRCYGRLPALEAVGRSSVTVLVTSLEEFELTTLVLVTGVGATLILGTVLNFGVGAFGT
jgi:hypothetical protein